RGFLFLGAAFGLASLAPCGRRTRQVARTAVNAARRRVVLVSEIARLGREQLDGLEEDFDLIDRYDLDNVRDEELLAAGLEGAWAVVAGSESYTGPLLDRLPGLQVIARCGVGFDAIDVV